MAIYVVLLRAIHLQLTTDTVEAAVASLAQAVEQTEGNEVEQNGAVLRTVADYLTDVATFVNNTNITIDSAVSYTLSLLLM